MELKNLMEEEVIHAVSRILMDEKEDMCTCEKCRLDIIAITLNNLKPKYVVTEKGEVYGRVDTMDYQFDADIVTEIVKAIEIVRKHPQHEKV